MTTELTIPIITKQVHFLDGIVGHGVIGTLCDARLQHGDNEWNNHVNHWGRVGIRKYRPFTHLTLDPAAVTCRRCLPRLPRVREVAP